MTNVTGVAAAGHLLERARWAAAAYADYDRATVAAIVAAAAVAAHTAAERLAGDAVSETSMGVVADQDVENRACSRDLTNFYQDADFVSARVTAATNIVEIPRPAGVVLARIPAASPVASVYSVLLPALMTRNAVVVVPHPRARLCSAAATRLLADAAVAAGAPDGVLQVLDDPSELLAPALPADERVNVVVESAGPGNVPVLVDASADVAAAARQIVDSAAFDNSLLPAAESVVIAVASVAEALVTAMSTAGAAVLDDDASDRLRTYLFSGGVFNADAVGRDAVWIAAQAGISVPPQTRALVAPVRQVVEQEMLAHPKPAPVLALATVPDAARGIRAARAVVRIGGSGHSAAIHTGNAALVADFAAQVPVLRVSVNVGGSAGGTGLVTNLAPSTIVGSGFAGRSSLRGSLRPDDLVNWTRVAYGSGSDVVMPAFTGIQTGHAPAGPVPEYPRASNERDAVGPR